MIKKHRAFLKWAGGKYGLCDVINKMLPKGDRLIEPFVGAGSVVTKEILGFALIVGNPSKEVGLLNMDID